MLKTSVTHPLRVDAVAAPGGGVIGLTFCPGMEGDSRDGGAWVRDLAIDIQAIAAWAPDAVVTLMETDELARYGVAALPSAMTAAIPLWRHLPIVDLRAPGPEFERRWKEDGPRLRAILRCGGRVLVHCRGGIGRTGTVAARLLVELGEMPEAAIDQVRAARDPRCVETSGQAAHVLGCRFVAEEGAA